MEPSVTRARKIAIANHANWNKSALTTSKRLIRRGRCHCAQPRYLRKRSTRVLIATHFSQNVRQQNVLTRLVRLSSNCPLLQLSRLLESLLVDADQGEQSQCFGVVNIEKAGETQFRFSSSDVVLLRIKMTERERRTVMPPIRRGKMPNDRYGCFGTFGHSAQFGFVANQFPHPGIGVSRFLQNLQRALIVFRFVSELGQIKHCQPCPRIILLRSCCEFSRRFQKSFRFGFFSLQPQYCGERVARRWIIRIRLQNSAQELLGSSVFTASTVNLSKVYGNTHAVGPGRERALVKRILVGPIAASNKTARSERDNCDCCGALHRVPPTGRHFDYAAD